MNIEESIKEMKSLSPSEKAIETLLTAYEKEKGENVILRLQDIPLIEGELKAYKDRVNELKQKLEKEKEKNKEVQDELENWKFTTKYVEDNYIHKDKIKAKIEEYDNKGMTINLTNRSAGKTFQQAVHYEVKKVLQSLLEKE